MKRKHKMIAAISMAAVMTAVSSFTAFAAEPADDSEMLISSIADMIASEFGVNNDAGIDRTEHDTGHIYVGVAVTDGAVDEDNSNWSDRAEEENGVISIAFNDDVEGEGFTAARVYGEGTVTVTGDLRIHDDGDGTYDSDFTGMGAAVTAAAGADVYVDDVNFYSEGVVRSFGNVSSSLMVVENSDIVAMGANPFATFYEDYCNTADTVVMISPPWVLGIQGAVRGINLLGQNSTLVVADSSVTSGGWAVFSTDIGSNPYYWIYNTSMNILPESEGGMNSGWKILGYDEDAYGSGYGAFLIGSAVEHFYGVDINGPTYAAIQFGGDAYYEGLKKGEKYEALDSATGDVVYVYEAEEDKDTTVNTVFGFLAQTAGTVTMEEGSVFNTAEAVALYKDANVDWIFSGAEINPESGIIIQMMDSDNGTIGSIPEGFDSYFYEEAGFPTEAFEADASYVHTSDSKVDLSKTYYEEKGENEYAEVADPTDEGTVAYFEKTTPGTYGTALFEEGEYNGDIYNGTGYFGQAPDALDVTIAKDAVLNGDIALTTHVHGMFLNDRDVDDVIAAIEEANEAHAGITGHYADLDDIEYVFLDETGEVTENKDDAVALQFTQFTTMEYYLVGHVINKVYYNGASHLDVIVNGTWRPQNESLVTYLEIADSAHVYGELQEQEDGSFLILPSEEEVEPGIYGTKFVFVEDPNGSSGGESAEGESAEAEAAEGESAEGEATESAEGESAEGESAEGESAEGEITDADSADVEAMNAVDAESADAESADAESADAESAEGESAEGESAEGDAIVATEGESTDAESAEGESAEGESAEGDAIVAAEGESAEDEAASEEEAAVEEEAASEGASAGDSSAEADPEAEAAAAAEKERLETRLDYTTIPADGEQVELGYIEGVTEILEVDGLKFKDMNKNGELDVYEDWREDIEDRIADLLSQLTDEELAGLLFCGQPATTSAIDEMNKWNMFCMLYNENGTPETITNTTNNLQAAAEETRLGIPWTFTSDREYNAWGGYIDKAHEAFGSAYDPELAYDLAYFYGQAMRAVGIHVTFEPYAEEIGAQYGENTKLIADVISAEVKGLEDGGLASCTKHWIGRGGDSSFGAARSVAQNFDNWMVGWKAALEAGAEWVMTNCGGTGITNTTDVKWDSVTMGYLRDELGFDGIVVTDWWALGGGPNNPGRMTGITVEGEDLSTKDADWLYNRALELGTDVFGGGYMADGTDYESNPMALWPQIMIDGIKSGVITKENAERSAARVIRFKMNKGLFENPYCDVDAAIELTASDEWAEEQFEVTNDEELRAARNPYEVELTERLQYESAILVKNDDNLLPLEKGIKVYVDASSAATAEAYSNYIGEYAEVVDDPEEADVMIGDFGQINDACELFLEDAYDYEKPAVLTIETLPTQYVLDNAQAVMYLRYSQGADHGSTEGGFITGTAPWVYADMLFGELQPEGIMVKEVARDAVEDDQQWKDLAGDQGADPYVRLIIQATMEDDEEYHTSPNNWGDPLIQAFYGMSYGEEPDFVYSCMILPMSTEVVTEEVESGGSTSEQTTAKTINTAIAGEPFTAYVLLRNNGGDGITNVEAYVDGELAAEKTYTVTGDSWRVVQIDLIIDEPGEHEIMIGDQVQTITVGE